MKKIEILVVEDSVTQASVLKYILESNDYSVQHATDGIKALELLKQYFPDVIISDIVMPGMDGYEFCSILKADENLKKIPVILLSALSVPRDIMKGIECGADSFLVKPYTEELLIARIEYFVSNAALRADHPDDSALEILFGDKKYSINSSPRQILDILLSTYEISIHKNKELVESNRNLQIARDNLTRLNFNLEEQVNIRTKELEDSNKNLLSEIKEHKATEETLQKSEEKWKKLVTTIPDYIALHDSEGKFLFLNHFAEGFTMKEIEGKHVTDFQVGESKIIYQNAFDKAKQTGETQKVEHLAFGDNYTQKAYESYIIPIFDDGKFMNMLVIARDITERKKSEIELMESNEIFRQFMEHSPIYIFFKDENIRTLKLSRNFEKMLGKPLKELIGKNMDELFPSDLAKKMIADDLQILKNGKEVTIEEEMNGRQYTTKKFPIQIEGKPSFLAGYTIDITESKRAEQVIKENEQRLRDLNATKDKFFSIIAHDLKNPFNSIIGFSNLLVEKIQEKDYDGIGEFANFIQHSSERAMDLLLNLLQWSRSQTGRMEYNPKPIEMGSLIDEVTQLLNDSALQKSITISVDNVHNSFVTADQNMITTIIRNLISNAIKFSQPGGKIIIAAEQRPDECLISVSDNGVGIKKEKIEKLFRIDENTSTSGTQNETGTGLGLILCKEFIEKHGGQIWVESEVGKGSSFYFTIPKG